MKPADMKVLLTGATGGIGERLATVLAVRGARLLLTARDTAKLDGLCERLSARGTHCESVAADIGTAEGRAALLVAARRFEGGINVLVNNAGINRFGLFAEHDPSEIAALLETNVVAPMLLTRGLLPVLARQPASLVVNLGSVIGSIGVPGQVAYASSKFALHGFSESLRRELAGSTTRVVYVAPRSTDTGMNDEALRQMNEAMGVSSDDPGVVATKIADAITTERRERFIGWPERLFVKINALVPGLVDRALEKQSKHLATEPAGPSPATPDGVNQ